MFLLLLAVSAAAQGMYEQDMSNGISSLEKKDYGAAEEAFRAALKEVPDDYKASLYLGIVLNRKGEKESQRYLKKALFVNPDDPSTNLELGVYYYNRSVYPEAMDYFENTIEIAPGTKYSAEAREYIERMTRPKAAKKPWRVDAALGMQYDSNVIVGPDNMPPPEGISRKSDWSGVLYLKGQYDLLTSDRFVGTVSYSAYQSLHTKLTDFNITQQVAGVDAVYELTKGFALKGSYKFEYVLVGGDEYDYAHTLTPTIIFTYGKGFSTVINYSYSNFHFSNSDLFPDNSDRTGFNHSGTVTQYVPLADFLDVRLGFAVDKDVTRRDFWAYQGVKGFGGLTFKILPTLSADAYGEYYNRKYEGVSPISGYRRNDNIQTYSFTVTQKLSDIFSIAAGEIYVENRSNIDVFKYKRSITSAFLTARF
jgi:hypothetical protein